MKNYSTKPTDENALELLRTDPIGRNKDVYRFINLLSRLDSDCYSVALNGEWGSGKTFFIKQTKLVLDAFNPQSTLNDEFRSAVKKLISQDANIPESYTTVYYDAWA